MGGDENNGPAGLGRTSTERRWIRKYGGMCQFHGAIPSVGKIYTFCYLTVTRDVYECNGKLVSADLSPVILLLISSFHFNDQRVAYARQ